MGINLSSLVQISGNLLIASFILYLLAILFFAGSIRDKKSREKNVGPNRWSQIGITITIIGFITQIGYFITRWIAAGHIPISNMFEFTTFFGMMLIGAFILIYFIYRLNLLGLFALPLAVILIAFASMFPKDITPLIPSLQNRWFLAVHVATAAIGQAILVVSFVAGVIYLLKVINTTVRSRKTFALEAIMYIMVLFIGYIVSTVTFQLAKYEVSFQWINKDGNQLMAYYNMPPLLGPNEGIKLTEEGMEPFFHLPAVIDAVKFNSLVWSIIFGTVIYILLRLILRKRISTVLQPLVKKVNLELIDEIGYRSVLIGFPIFSLGALVFGMIWAQIAWTRFWGWDPKEVWALITFLFYSAFLHLRLSRGWHGEKSAWLAVIGFSIIMFNLIVVNLILAGLHSYA